MQSRLQADFASPVSMETAVVKRVALEKDLRHAVTARQFVLHYQALVVAKRGQARIKSIDPA